MVHIAEGLSNKEIACKLGVGVRTVETHRERIMRKLDIHSAAGLTRYAISNGLVTLSKSCRILKQFALKRAGQNHSQSRSGAEILGAAFLIPAAKASVRQARCDGTSSNHSALCEELVIN